MLSALQAQGFAGPTSNPPRRLRGRLDRASAPLKAQHPLTNLLQIFWLARRYRRLQYGGWRWIAKARRVGVAKLAVLIAGVGLALTGLAALGPGWVRDAAVGSDPLRASLRAQLSASDLSSIQKGYAARGFRPIWIKDGHLAPETALLVQRLSESRYDGLDPRRYAAASLRARIAHFGADTTAEQAETDLLLTKSLVDFALDLHTPNPTVRVAYVDPALPAPSRPLASDVFELIGASSSLRAAYDAATRMNPLYADFRTALQANALDSSILDQMPIRMNLERLRALPISLGRRFILVNTAAARLSLYDGGRLAGAMAVIVGSPREPTPQLAGIVRYAVFNPSWDIPPDLVRNVYAPRIRADRSVLTQMRLEPWTGYLVSDHRLDPAQVNWDFVAAGLTPIGLKQRPGPWNEMGAVKFMLPNTLGIYLHDTPNKALFQRASRTLSAGCVRVEDYRRLARWLFERSDLDLSDTSTDRQSDLRRPAPVYLVYLTRYAQGGRIVDAPDVYGWDARAPGG